MPPLDPLPPITSIERQEVWTNIQNADRFARDVGISTDHTARLKKRLPVTSAWRVATPKDLATLPIIDKRETYPTKWAVKKDINRFSHFYQDTEDMNAARKARYDAVFARHYQDHIEKFEPNRDRYTAASFKDTLPDDADTAEHDELPDAL